jgi:hypothetical protein
MRRVPSNLGATIYGLLAVGALFAAESARRETYGETVAAVAVASVLIWLAHGYAEFASWRMREGKRFTAHDFGRTMVQELSILVGASLPLLAVLIAWAAGASLTSGVIAGLWTVAATIVTIEVVSAVRAKLSGRELLVQAAVGAGLGLLVLAMRVILQH